jgi:hypothetical protein
MAGTVRPYTLADIIGTLNTQSSEAQGSIVPLQGFFGSTNETTTLTGTFTTSVQANPAWDAGRWGLVTWG